MEALPACLLRDVAQEALGVAVIGIDEGQFVSWFVLAFCLQTPYLSPPCPLLTWKVFVLFLIFFFFSVFFF